MNIMTLDMSGINQGKCPSLAQSLWRSEQIRHREAQAAAAAGISLFELMARAGLAVFEQARLTWPEAASWWFFTGGGNNAGDGYVVARLAQTAGIAVRVIQVGDAARLSGDAARARDAYLLQGGVINALDLDEMKSSLDEVKNSLDEMKSTLDEVKDTLDEAGNITAAPKPDLIIDALLGTGLTGAVREEVARHIDVINQLAVPVLAIDVPSGLCADTGHIVTVAVQAELTLCLLGLKLGLLTGRGPDVVGRLLLADLGVNLGGELEVERDAGLDGEQDAELNKKTGSVEQKPVARLMLWSDWRQRLPKRRVGAYKGEAGRLLVIGGHLGMSGAIRLAGEAALRSGAGLVRLLSHKDHQASLNLTRPELMTASFPDFNDWDWASSLVLGPGLGRDDWSERLFNAAMQHSQQHSQQHFQPTVIDADGLWWLAKHPQRAVASNPWVLTPHSGEAARLLGCTVGEIEADRLAAVHSLQQQYGGVVILKGAGSLIADERQVRLCHYGNNGMASGGMGDVLSGIIGALMAQGLTPFNAASLAVCLHALAGDRAARQGKHGMLAADLFLPLRQLINQDDEYDDTYATNASCRRRANPGAGH